MNKEYGDKADKWNTVRKQVDGTWEEFLGREVSQLVVAGNPSSAEPVDRFFTLYETPDEGYKLYLVEARTNAADDVRTPNQKAADITVRRVLYSEEAIRRDYSHVLKMLLERKQVNY